jgi:two-component system, chemotaxis family, sensor kinase Cph1
VRADVVQLSQLFQNLIGNALKYRGKEAPLVKVAAHRREDKWLFSVNGNGEGVPPHERERIFTPLKRLHGREIPGTGIGLAICTKIVARAGGRADLGGVKCWTRLDFLFHTPVDRDGSGPV